MLNKVLFVSLLVLGLYFQPALGTERLSTRVAGGFAATKGQFPWAIVYTYQYTPSGGSTQTYQGTGVLYNDDVFITSANALSQCTPGTVATAYQNLIDVNVLDSTVSQSTFTCGSANSVTQRPGFVSGIYKDDFAVVQLDTAFPAGNTLRPSTSSPIQSPAEQLWVVGFGENSAGTVPSPQLVYAPINPMNNRVCYDIFNLKFNAANTFSFADSFCVQGQVDDPRTGFLTDACVLDAGGAIIRSSDIANAAGNAEVIGIVNFATCQASAPVIVSYIFKFNDILPDQTDIPAAGIPSNSLANFGVFACGDGAVQDGDYEQCDIGQNPDLTDLSNNCCNKFTCKFEFVGTECGTTNNHTVCLSAPRCNANGQCVVNKRLFNKKACNGENTICKQGRCCQKPNPKKNDPLSCV